MGDVLQPRGFSTQHLAAIESACDQKELEDAYLAAHTWAKGAGEALAPFKAAYSARSEALKDPPLQDALKNMVRRGMQIVQARLDTEDEDAVPDQLALRAIEVGARALGLGVKQEVAPVQINMNMHLEALGENLVKVLRRERRIEDARASGERRIIDEHN